MAEPAPIYDPGEDEKHPRPNLSAREGGGEVSPPQRDWYTANSPKKAASPKDLSKAESAGAGQHEGQVGGGYTGPGQSKPSRLRGIVKTRRRKLLLGAGLAAAIAAGSIAIFLALIPLKIMHIMNNLQSRFFATSETAVQKETDTLLSHYLRKYALGKLDPKRCRSTIDRSCRARVTGDNFVQRLYRGWAQSNLEADLANKYGLELQKDKSGYKLRKPGLPDTPIDDFANGRVANIWDSNGFKGASRSEVRQAFHSAYDGETRWKQVMYRFKVGRLLETKYGIKRCLVFCNTRDSIADFKDKTKRRVAMAFLTQRILVPRTEMTRLIIECVLTPQCDPLAIFPDVPDVGADGCHTHCLNNGEPLSQTERDITSRLTSLVASWRITEPDGGERKVKELLAKYDDFSKRGFATVLADDVIKAYILRQEEPEGRGVAGKAADSLSSVLRPLGYISFVDTVYNLLRKAPEKLQKLNYVMNSSTMVGYYAMYRTYSDECIKNGSTCDATMLGSFTQALSAGNQNPDNPNDHEYGGTAEAEGAPIYSVLLGGNSSGGKNILSSLFGSRAYAAPAPETCYDGHKDYPMPPGKLVCPEVELGGISAFTAKIKAFLASPIGRIMDGIDQTFGRVLRLINKLISFLVSIVLNIPGIKQLVQEIINLITGAAQRLGLDSFIQVIINYALKPPPIGTNNSGARTVEMIAGGTDVAGNDFAHHSLGGKVLSASELTAILDDQQQQQLQEYKNKSFFARMFDTQSNYSPIAKLAAAMPTSASQGISGALSSLLTNPLAKITGGFGSLFNGPSAYAATNTVIKDPFDVTQYGYPVNDPIFSQDPEQYWLQHCSTPNQTNLWNEEAVQHINPDTQMSYNITTNPCLLIQAAVGSAGATFTSDVLTPDDLATSTGGSTSTTTGGTTGSGSTIPPGIPAGDSSTPCDPRTRDIGIYTGYQNGSPVQIRLCSLPNMPCSNEECNNGYGIRNADGHALVNSTVSKNFYDLVAAAKAAGVSLTATSTFRTIEHQRALCPCDGVRVAVPGYSNHQMGLAIDFGGLPSSAGPIPGNPVWGWLSANANKFGIYNYPAEAWHWSPTGH